jgi:hypothetical protein
MNFKLLKQFKDIHFNNRSQYLLISIFNKIMD